MRSITPRPDDKRNSGFSIIAIHVSRCQGTIDKVLASTCPKGARPPTEDMVESLLQFFQWSSKDFLKACFMLQYIQPTYDTMQLEIKRGVHVDTLASEVKDRMRQLIRCLVERPWNQNSTSPTSNFMSVCQADALAAAIECLRDTLASLGQKVI